MAFEKEKDVRWKSNYSGTEGLRFLGLQAVLRHFQMKRSWVMMGSGECANGWAAGRCGGEDIVGL